jgi:hypothetical protein
MKKATEILKLRTLHIFLLITVPMAIKYYSTDAPDATIFFTMLNLFGYLMYMIWFYATGLKGNEKLKSKDLEIKEMQFFNVLILANIAIDLYFMFADTDYFVHNSGSLNITLPEPVGAYLIGLAIILYIKILTAKLILSIEKNRIVEFKDYYKTWILLLIPYIGILFVHYRVKEKIAGFKSK